MTAPAGLEDFTPGDWCDYRCVSGKETRNQGTADPIVIKHATTDLDEDVSGGRLERSFDVGSALGARLGEEQSFLLCPSFTLLHWDLSSLEREIVLVSHENAR
jgi:hypothetical protein